MGPSSGNRPFGSGVISRHLKVLLPPCSSSSCSCPNKLRISGELARRLVDGAAGGTALLVSPVGGKVCRVEVGRDDGDGAFLGRGWPEFVAAHGIGAGWFVVFRHEGGATLTVKAFGTSCCLHEFSRPINVDDTIAGGGSRRRPQFIKVLLHDFTEKTLIPPEFVRNHMTEAETEMIIRRRQAVALLNLSGKYWRVEVQKEDPSSSSSSSSGSDNDFFFSGAGGWSRFLASNGITEGEALLLRYEGNLVFTVKAFGLDGSQKSFIRSTTKTKPALHEHETEQTGQMELFTETKDGEDDDAPSSSTGKRRKGRGNDEAAAAASSTSSGVAETKRPATTSSSATPPPKKGTAAAVARPGGRILCPYDIGPRPWIKKEMTAKTRVVLASSFCNAIGFVEPCDITLRTSGAGGGRSWQVRGLVYSSSRHHELGKGWASFRRDNGLKEGDVCTFKIIETRLWHVDIVRRS